MPEHDLTWLQRLDEYADRFRDDFRRRDQLRWAAVYLQGLLLPAGERKTIGTMARRVALPPDLVVDDVAQALQNFVNQSPWDERRAARRHRALMAEGFAGPDGAFVLDELAVVKQGQHSVGVQRQYSSALGRKTNCQIAVALHHAGRDGDVCPLSVRLYLPRGWLAGPARLDAAAVPEEHRRPQSKATIALELLDEARAEGWTAPAVVAGVGYGADRTFREALAARGLAYVAEVPPDAVPGPDEFRWPSGGGDDGEGPYLLGNCPPDTRESPLQRWAERRRAARELSRLLMQDLGLEHFEGRSWRGFHHHACLVLLAFGFQTLAADKPLSVASAAAG